MVLYLLFRTQYQALGCILPLIASPLVDFPPVVFPLILHHHPITPKLQLEFLAIIPQDVETMYWIHQQCLKKLVTEELTVLIANVLTLTMLLVLCNIMSAATLCHVIVNGMLLVLGLRVPSVADPLFAIVLKLLLCMEEKNVPGVSQITEPAITPNAMFNVPMVLNPWVCAVPSSPKILPFAFLPLLVLHTPVPHAFRALAVVAHVAIL